MVDITGTIVAIATPPGRSAIGVVRVSGPDVKNIISRLLGIPLKPRLFTLCKFVDDKARVIDQGLAVYFPGPASFTGEDILELHAHGSRVVLDLLVRSVILLGARQAKPGEFTERAFHNNKIDLVQAEAVAALIDAASEQAARSAVRSLEGEFSVRVNNLLGEIIKTRVFIESLLDFPEEDTGLIENKGIINTLNYCRSEVENIIATARQGAILKEGATMAIIGKPNVGKSTLLNLLAGREAAIVTEIPGTTRDVISQEVLIDGVPLHVIDTAGIRITPDKVEQEGVRRARQAALLADIVILMKDHLQAEDRQDQDLLEEICTKKSVIIVNNKIDLAGLSPKQITSDKVIAEIYMSAKTGEGTELLISCLKEILGTREMREDVFMARGRHLAALERVSEYLERSFDCMQGDDNTELMAEELRMAQQALGEITGEYTPDDLLGEIFSTFCIGK